MMNIVKIILEFTIEESQTYVTEEHLKNVAGDLGAFLYGKIKIPNRRSVIIEETIERKIL